jgi:hypothetical protein
LKITLIGRKKKPFISGFDTPMRPIDLCESKGNFQETKLKTSQQMILSYPKKFPRKNGRHIPNFKVLFPNCQML